jgi:DNA polymerase-3 subunit delta'
MAITVYPWHQAAWQSVLARKERLPHALLIRGREGIGKREFARRLAQSLACPAPDQDGAACGVCQSCRWFEAGAHPDFREVIPESMQVEEGTATLPADKKPSERILIEAVRGLEDFIHLTPHQLAGKTIVFYPAESLHPNAANALLKTIEEPPASTRFLFVCHRPSYLPATIISRCQLLTLPVPRTEVAVEWLRENGVAEPELALAQSGDAPLVALRLALEEHWAQRKQVLEKLTLTPFEPLLLAEQIRDYAPARLLGWLQRWSYDLLMTRLAGGVRYNPDFSAVLGRLAGGLNPRDIVRFHRLVVAWQGVVNHPLNPRLFIEHMLLSYAALMRGDFSESEPYAG